MDKRGQTLGEFLPLFWRLALITVVIFVIVFSVGNVFSSKQDVRPTEVILLAKTISGCIAPEGKLNANFKLEDCISGNVKDYYVNVSVNSFESNFSSNKLLGNPTWGELCALSLGETEGKFSLKCLEQKYYVLIEKDSKLEGGILNILVGIEKAGENVQVV